MEGIVHNPIIRAKEFDSSADDVIYDESFIRFTSLCRVIVFVNYQIIVMIG
jgi:hypothetical protein